MCVPTVCRSIICCAILCNREGSVRWNRFGYRYLYQDCFSKIKLTYLNCSLFQWNNVVFKWRLKYIAYLGNESLLLTTQVLSQELIRYNLMTLDFWKYRLDSIHYSSSKQYESNQLMNHLSVLPKSGNPTATLMKPFVTLADRHMREARSETGLKLARLSLNLS